MKSVSRLNKVQLKEEIIKRRIKIRKFQGEAIYQCLPGKIPADHMSRNANDKIWDVILFIGLHDSSAVPLASSDIFLGTELPKRTVIRIIDKLETLNRASRASQKGADLVKQLLAFSRRQTLRTLPIDLNKSVANATQMVAGTLGENITIATDFDEDLWTTAADPVQVENILLNLTLNARDAMKSGGVVGIKTENAQYPT